MKRIISILSLFIISSVFLSCAEQLTMREKEMKKYESIDMSVAEGMPEGIKTTITAYNDGDYASAAMGFYSVMKNPAWSRLHETARYYYAESLFRMGLYKASEYQLQDILFNDGVEGHYFMSSLLKLLAVSYNTNDEKTITAVLSNIDNSKLPKKFANELMYYLGKINFYDGKDDVALQMFSKVKDYSSFYPGSVYFTGVIQVRKGRIDKNSYAEAMKSFTKIKEMPDDKYVGADIKKLKNMAQLALGELYYAAGNDPDSKNPLAMINTSLNYFNNVSRDNEQWFESLFARTWASVMISRFDSTLGTIVTLKSPFFTDIYFPEINIVEAVTYYNLCRYQDVNRVVDSFFKVYPVYRQKMTTYLENVSTKNALDHYKDMLKMYNDAVNNEGVNAALPLPVLRTIVFDPVFKRKYNHIKEIERELALVEASPEKFKTSKIAEELRGKMLTQLANLRIETGQWMINYLQSLTNQLTDVIANAKAIQFEMTDREKSALEKEEQFGKKASAAVKIEDKAFNPSVRDNAYFWPFEGEYWEDELGFYFYNIQSSCVGEE